MRPVPFVLPAILGFAGCAAAPPVGAESVAAEVPVAGPPLVRSAFAGSPALDAARADRDAADARTDQAGRWPDPRLTIETRDVPTGPVEPVRGGRWVTWTQPVAVGGRIRAATDAARAGRDAADLAVAVERARLRATILRACARVVAAVACAAAAERGTVAARELVEASEAALRDGTVSAEGRDAAASVSIAAESERRARAAELASAIESLRALAGCEVTPGDAADVVRDASIRAPEPGPVPQLALASTRVTAARLGLDAERAKRIPDIEVSIGAGRQGDRDAGFVEGAVTIPLPVFDGNGARVREAAALVRRAEADARVAETDHRLRSSQATAELHVARATVADHERSLLPAVRRAAERAEAAHREGRTSVADLARARMRLAAAEAAHAESVRATTDAEAACVELSIPVPAMTEEAAR